MTPEKHLCLGAKGKHENMYIHFLNPEISFAILINRGSTKSKLPGTDRKERTHDIYRYLTNKISYNAIQ